jgi:hypothetical protein
MPNYAKNKRLILQTTTYHLSVDGVLQNTTKFFFVVVEKHNTCTFYTFWTIILPFYNTVIASTYLSVKEVKYFLPRVILYENFLLLSNLEL